MKEPNVRSLKTPSPGDLLDSALIARIRIGDQAAFRELYAKYYHPLLRFIYRLTNQLECAQEGVNDVMLVVWSNASAFEGKSRVATWLLGIAYRKGLKLRQRSKRWWERFKSEDLVADDELCGTPEEHIGDLRDLLEKAMLALPVKQRAVVELTYFYGYSYEEIAAIVDCPVNTVKTRMFHARARLKKLLPALSNDELVK